MYSKVECVCITCDNCNTTLTGNHSGFSIFVDEDSARSEAERDEWELTGGKHYCPDCFTIDNEDNLILKEVSK